ncbi:MAG: hypothetical protein H0X64_13495, partial [Gemmatimonadaceae bacterium]|nr:hypothetical protein [Gemmatimonadaceae bacterium]
RDDMICRAIADEDERIRRAGLLAAQTQGCPDTAVPVLAQSLVSEASNGIAELMVKVLAPVHSPLVLRAFASMVVSPKRRWFRKVPASVSPAMLAALTVLATSWREEPEGAAALAIVKRSEDTAVQRILSRGGAPA